MYSENKKIGRVGMRYELLSIELHLTIELRKNERARRMLKVAHILFLLALCFILFWISFRL